jgi:hypothetical protein
MSTTLLQKSDENFNTKATLGQLVLYYFSFLLLWATVAFLAAMLLLNFEDKNIEGIPQDFSYAWYYILQFPFGLLYGLITGDYISAIFAFFINLFFLSISLQVLLRSGHKSIRLVSKFNFVIWVGFILGVTVYILNQ